jgi:hypothetical protein
MNLTLTRDYSGADCTLGKLTLTGLIWETMERPWVPDPSGGGLGGDPGLSCIPVGAYTLVLHDTQKHPKTWALVNADLGVVADPTPGMRSDILIHPANFASELEGCIAPGITRQNDGTQWMVTSSQVAMRQLQAALPWTLGHTLEIVQAALA